MIGPESERKSGEFCSLAGYLEKALECKGLQEMLRGSAGAFTFRYWFINEYINKFGVSGLKHAVDLDYGHLKKRERLPNLFKTIGQILKLGMTIARSKRHNPVDLLFVSRNRKARIKTQSGYQEGDYIFYSVVADLKKRSPELSLAMYLIEDTYIKYEYASLFEVLQSVCCTLRKCISWNFHGKNLLDYFNEQTHGNFSKFARTFFSFRPFLRNALLGYSINSMLTSYSPRVIIANDDCLYTRPLLNRDFKMVVLQSASIGKNIEDCRSLIFRDSRMQPDIFLCSGSESAEIKARASAARAVVITGQPRYDILFNMQALYSKNDFRERYGINPEQKIVLWTTQTHGFCHEENCDNLQAVLEAFQRLDKVTLIIKQHPAETKVHTELINDFLDRYDVDAILTPTDSDTFEQLFACDLMITKHSTTAIEAVAMDKPVIILNLSKEPDIVDYVREKVAVGVYEKKDLRETIIGLLNDEGELKKNRDAYLGRYLFKIDGKATDRVVDVINQMIASQEC